MKIREAIKELFDTMTNYIHNTNDKEITHEVLKQIYINGYRDALAPVVEQLQEAWEDEDFYDYTVDKVFDSIEDENLTDIKIGGTDYD